MAEEQTFSKLAELLKARYREHATIERLVYPDHPLPIEQCYLDLALIEDKVFHDKKNDQNSTREESREYPLHSYERIQYSQRKLTPEQLPTECHTILKRIYIEGAAGAGKTTLSQFIAYQWSKGHPAWKGYDFLFRIRLRDLTSAKYEANKIKLIDIIKQECFGVGHNNKLKKNERKFLNKFIKTHPQKVLFILDGYDELSLENHAIKTLWESLIHSDYDFIITSRPGMQKASLKTQLNVAVLGFSDVQVEKYIQYVFDPQHTPDAQSQDAYHCLQTLRQIPNLWSLAHTPIQLELLCSIWKDNLKQTPDITLTQLYTLLFERLLKRCEQRQIEQEENRQININNIKMKNVLPKYGIYVEYLEYLAYLGMEKRVIVLSEKLDNEAYEEIVPSSKDSDKFYSQLAKLDFIKRDGNQTEFLHLSFQEYFAARYIVHCFKAQQAPTFYAKLPKFIQQRKNHPHYEIVWWFVAGLLKDNANLLTQYFDLLQLAPSDLAEFYQFNLQLHCLAECELCLEEHSKERLLNQSFKWIQYLLSKVNNFYFGPNVSIPTIIITQKELIETLSSHIKNNGIRRLNKLHNLPVPILAYLCDLLKDRKLESEAAEVLLSQTALPNSILTHICSILKDESEWSKATEILLSQTVLPDSILTRLCSILKEEKLQLKAVKILSNQTVLPNSILTHLCSLLKDENVRWKAVEVLSSQTVLPDCIFHHLCNLLKNKLNDEELQLAATKALSTESSYREHIIVSGREIFTLKYEIELERKIKNIALPKDILQRLVDLLKHKNKNIQYYAAMGLSHQTSLPTSILQQLVDLSLTEHYAALALSGFTSLPTDILQQLEKTLNSNNYLARLDTIVALRGQKPLPESILQELIKLLTLEEKNIQRGAAVTLSNQTSLPIPILQQLCDLLKNIKTQNYSAEILLLYRTPLPESILEQLINLLNYEDEKIKNYVAEILSNQKIFSQSTFCKLEKLLGHEDKNMDIFTIRAISNQMALPETILQQLISLIRERVGFRVDRKEILKSKTTLSKTELEQQRNMIINTITYEGYVKKTLSRQTILPKDILITLTKKNMSYEDIFFSTKSISINFLCSLLNHYQCNEKNIALLKIILLKCLNQKVALYFYGNTLYVGDETQGEFSSECQTQITKTMEQLFTEITGIPATIQHNDQLNVHTLDQTTQFQGDQTMENITSRTTNKLRETITLDVAAIKNAIALIKDQLLQNKLNVLLEKSVGMATMLNNAALNNVVFCKQRDTHIQMLQEEVKEISTSDEFNEVYKTITLDQILPDLIFPFLCCQPFLRIETETERAQNIAKEQRLFNEQKAIRNQLTFIQALGKLKEDRKRKESRKPKLYFMYAWPVTDYAQRESEIQEFLGNLRQDFFHAGIEAIFDREDNFSGNNLAQFIGQILQENCIVLVFGTESFRHKWFGHKTALQVEGDFLKLKWLTDFSERSIQPNQKTTIIPFVLTGIRETAIPEDLLPAKNPTVRALYNLSYQQIVSSLLAVAYGINEQAVAKFINDMSNHIVAIDPPSHSAPTNYSAIQPQTLFGRGIYHINNSNTSSNHTIATSDSLMKIEESNTNVPK